MHIDIDKLEPKQTEDQAEEEIPASEVEEQPPLFANPYWQNLATELDIENEGKPWNTSHTFIITVYDCALGSRS